MIVLGVDPGTRHTGLGTVEVEGSRERALGASTIHLGADLDHSIRLQRIYEGVLAAIDAHHPDELAVELPFMGKNAQSMLKLGRAQAAVMLAAMHREVPVAQYAPAEVKKAVVGNGRAAKEQVTFMVRQRLALTETLSEDAHDALAVALCHAARRPTGPPPASGPRPARHRPRPLLGRLHRAEPGPAAMSAASGERRFPERFRRRPEDASQRQRPDFCLWRRQRRAARSHTGTLSTATHASATRPSWRQSTSAASVTSPEAPSAHIAPLRTAPMASVAQNHRTAATAITLPCPSPRSRVWRRGSCALADAPLLIAHADHVGHFVGDRVSSR